MHFSLSSLQAMNGNDEKATATSEKVTFSQPILGTLMSRHDTLVEFPFRNGSPRECLFISFASENGPLK